MVGTLARHVPKGRLRALDDTLHRSREALYLKGDLQVASVHRNPVALPVTPGACATVAASCWRHA
jgi:hypothetical protein